MENLNFKKLCKEIIDFNNGKRIEDDSEFEKLIQIKMDMFPNLYYHQCIKLAELEVRDEALNRIANDTENV